MPETTTLTVADGKIKTGTLLDYLLIKFKDAGITKVEVKDAASQLIQDFDLDPSVSCLDAHHIVITSTSTINATEAQWVVNNHKTACQDKIPPIVEGLISALAPHVSMTKEQLRQAAIDNLPSS